jgi:tetratricopeptide (TPR) repeat protein
VLDAQPNATGALLARGRLLALQPRGDISAALTAFDRATALAPKDANARAVYGRTLLRVGESGAAARQFDRALQLSPAHEEALTGLGELRLNQRRYREACRALNAAIVSAPYYALPYALRGLARVRLNEVRDAWADAETAAQLGAPREGESVGAAVDAFARDTSRARDRTKRLKAQLADGTAPIALDEARPVARAAAAVGDADLASAVLERVYARPAAVRALAEDPTFDRVRRSGRLARLLSRLGPDRP